MWVTSYPEDLGAPVLQSVTSFYFSTYSKLSTEKEGLLCYPYQPPIKRYPHLMDVTTDEI